MPISNINHLFNAFGKSIILYRHPLRPVTVVLYSAILLSTVSTNALAACSGVSFCVTSTTDAGDKNAAGTLSWAIDQANRAGTPSVIGFDPAAFTGTSPTLTMTGTDKQTPRISGSVTIDGSATPGLTIDGSDQREIFFIRPDTPDLTIRSM